MSKIYCITGNTAKDELRMEILLAIKDGYTHFKISAITIFDLHFMATVTEIKSKYKGITFEAPQQNKNEV